MIYTPMTKKAMCIAYEAHRGQLDKTGVPYIFHPFHVAETMTNEAAVITALSLLAHNPAEDYMDYISRLSTCPLALQVKLGDLRHNSDVTRLDAMDEKMMSRQKKYAKAIHLLEAISGH